jgi:hypothetical protein
MTPYAEFTPSMLNDDRFVRNAFGNETVVGTFGDKESIL